MTENADVVFQDYRHSGERELRLSAFQPGLQFGHLALHELFVVSQQTIQLGLEFVNRLQRFADVEVGLAGLHDLPSHLF